VKPKINNPKKVIENLKTTRESLENEIQSHYSDLGNIG
jgi:hypothetical protein